MLVLAGIAQYDPHRPPKTSFEVVETGELGWCHRGMPLVKILAWAFGLVEEGFRCCGTSLLRFGLARDSTSAFSTAHCQVPLSTISFFMFPRLQQAFCWGNTASSFMHVVVNSKLRLRWSRRGPLMRRGH
ncbi:hypothetical protein LWI28_019086 [Acer negundo]|uniref:Uncharacterized protein n=1 Tax=Acer negundo TaxID=4023 RepID=A0AAD5IMC0_ACENE|nr:hypothetical protein LWI28_019086 [Acer negundo]